MTTIEAERSTYGIPHTAQELAWARIRPPEHRVPLPRVGQHVQYRHIDRHFGEFVVDARIIMVPRMDRAPRPVDVGPGREIDPNVWDTLRTIAGELLCDANGWPVFRLLPDPWPPVKLAVDWAPMRACGVRGFGHIDTREARLRGSAGWLPMDWRERWRPGPHHGGSVFSRMFAQPGLQAIEYHDPHRRLSAPQELI